MISARVTYRHRLFGLTIASAVPLPDLPAADPSALIDVRIDYGSVPTLAGAPDGYHVADGWTLLTVPQVGRFRIADGRRIVVDPAPAASERNLRLFVLGSAMGAILHQRGILPLHANAVAVGAGVVAFMGHSGAGKSTLAGWFHDRGHRILSDDVCAVTIDPARGPLVHPGIPRLRLWRDVLERTGRAADDYERSFDGTDKFDVPVSVDEADPLPLRAIYLLQKSVDDRFSIQRLAGAEAVAALVGNTYRGGYIRLVGATGRHLRECVSLARTVPLFAVNRVWGHRRFEEEAQLLDRHAAPTVDAEMVDQHRTVAKMS